jgi:hypothetical protein
MVTVVVCTSGTELKLDIKKKPAAIRMIIADMTAISLNLTGFECGLSLRSICRDDKSAERVLFSDIMIFEVKR